MITFILLFALVCWCTKINRARKPRRFRAKGAILSTVFFGPLGLAAYAATRDDEDR